MKKFILAATALVSAAAISTAANAADIAPAAYDWTGFYFGVNAGAAWNNSDVQNDLKYNGTGAGGYSPGEINDFLSGLGDDLNGDQTAFTGGALMGYNWQQDALVIGAEADFNYLGFSDDRSRDRTDIAGDVGLNGIDSSSDLSFDANWFGTLRGRLGFAADNFLFYGTGGLAYGHLEAKADVSVTDGTDTASFSESTSATNWGWTVGAGMEYGIDNWSLGVEYLYVDLGSAEWDGDVKGSLSDSAANSALSDITGDGNVDYKFSVVRATAKIRF